MFAHVCLYVKERVKLKMPGKAKEEALQKVVGRAGARIMHPNAQKGKAKVYGIWGTFSRIRRQRKVGANTAEKSAPSQH